MAENLIVTYPILNELSKIIQSAGFGEHIIGQQIEQGDYEIPVIDVSRGPISSRRTTKEAFERGLRRNWGGKIGDIYACVWEKNSEPPKLHPLTAMTLDKYLDSRDKFDNLLKKEFPKYNPHLQPPSIEFRANITEPENLDPILNLVLRCSESNNGQFNWTIIKERKNG